VNGVLEKLIGLFGIEDVEGQVVLLLLLLLL
jgi:hypothetical protein